MATSTACSDLSDGNETCTSSQATSSAVPSLLSKLRTPPQSELMRKRKIRVNPPPHTGAKKKKPSCSTDPKSVSVTQRVNEFPGEMLTNSAGKLFYSVCREELSLKLSIMKSHVESAKHARNKQQLK